MSFTDHYYKIKSVTFLVLFHVGGKHVFEISSNIRHKPGCTANEDDFRLDFSAVRKKRDCTIHEGKTTMLTSCFVTAQLICAFDFAIEKSSVSHVAAQIMEAIFFIKILPMFIRPTITLIGHLNNCLD